VRRLAVVVVGCRSASNALVATALLVVLVPILRRLVLATPHPYITANADAATLLSDHTTQCSALGQARKLLGGEDSEGCRLDLCAVGDKVVAVVDDIGVFRVQVLHLAQVLEEGEAQSILALVAD
jgi:hypothetical protein